MPADPPTSPLTRFDYVLAAEFGMLERARMVTEDYDGGRDEYRSFRAAQFSAAHALEKRVLQLENSTLPDDAARLAQKLAARKDADDGMIQSLRETLDRLRRRALQEKIDAAALQDDAATLHNTFIILSTAEGAMKGYPQPHLQETEKTKTAIKGQIARLASHGDGLTALDGTLDTARTQLQQMQENNESRARAKKVAGYIQGGTGARTTAPRTASFGAKRGQP